MTFRTIALGTATLVALAGCGPAGPTRDGTIGAISGGAVGLVAASAAGANTGGTAAAIAAGATVGAIVGQANGQRTCTFARPDAPYAAQPC